LSFTETDWNHLISQIKNKRCTPFIGAGASFPWLPLGSQIAQDWAQQYEYPLEDNGELDKVSQFVGILNDDEMFPKMELCNIITGVVPPDFTKYKDSPYAILSKINFPIYITTNYDKFMEEALKNIGRIPDSEYCRWNEAIELAGENSLFLDSEYKPTESRPLVYHLHGSIDIPQSIVLTERDYIYFLINLSKDERLLPTAIRKALASTSLLFIGYSLGDINFRVIFQGIMSIVKPHFQLPSIAVQLPPNYDEDKKEKIMKYLNRYTKNMFKVRIHWGDAKEFVNELQKRMEGT
jgi:hypothetical protein